MSPLKSEAGYHKINQTNPYHSNAPSLFINSVLYDLLAIANIVGNLRRRLTSTVVCGLCRSYKWNLYICPLCLQK